MMRVKIHVLKTVVLFIAIHMMIGLVAERKEKKAEQQLNFTKASVFTGIAKMDEQYDVMKMQPLQWQGGSIVADKRLSKKPLSVFQ